MPYNAIPCNTMQYHAPLITADGAYHCPVGSIWLFFNTLEPLWKSALHQTRLSPTSENDSYQFECGLCVNWSHYANIFGPSHYLRCRPQYYHWHQVFLTTSAQNHGYHINSMNIKYFERKYYKNWPKYYPCLYWECLFKFLSQKQPVRIF